MFKSGFEKIAKKKEKKGYQLTPGRAALIAGGLGAGLYGAKRYAARDPKMATLAGLGSMGLFTAAGLKDKKDK